MNFIFEQIETGGDRNFGYLIGDRGSGEAALVDPSYDPKRLIERAKAQGLKVKWILNTHGHYDHTDGNADAQKMTGAKTAIFGGSGTDVSLKDGQEISLGPIAIRCLHLPGHCDDHVVFFIPQYNVAITGDLLFVGKIGGTATEKAARTEYESLQKLLKLPPETSVWPGHNYGCRPSSTLALEKECNPFLRCKTVEEFLELKKNWPEYKRRHGLM